MRIINNISLDSPEVFRKYDPEGMLERIKELPGQCRQAWQEAMSFNLPDDYASVDSVVVLGMGGSAIGGDLVRSLTESESRVPVLIHRDYGLPAFVDSRTLVIASSYSGDTEETLSAFGTALEKGAKNLVITTGGKLRSIAEQKNIPLFRISYKAQPRAALGFSFLPLLCFLQKLGFLKDKSADVAETAQVLLAMLKELDETMPQSNNQAKQLARRLYGCLPVIYGGGILAEVAHRWKTQINENSKAWSFYEIFPELNHNATVGYKFPEELASRVRVVLLHSPSLHKRVQLRYEITCEPLDRARIGHEFVDSRGSSPLSQMMSLVLFGDLVSYYLAILYRVDPSPVEVISRLKERLARG